MNGVLAVARMELTLRVRKGRWRWLLGVWFTTLALFTLLLRTSIERTAGREVQLYRGAVMYGGLMLLVLSLALLVAPALGSQSVNGDRERGVLATLQVTRLAAWQITLGKFLATWGAMLAFLVVTAPLVLWCVAEGGVSGRSVLVVSVVMTVLLGTVCAVALGLSALLARSTTSAVLSYLAVFTLTIGTLIAFGLALSITQETYQATYDVGDGTTGTYEHSQARPDRVWWLLAPNPFVVLADSAPYRPRCIAVDGDGRPVEVRQRDCRDTGLDPLGGMGRSVRDLRIAPQPPCGTVERPSCEEFTFEDPPVRDRPPVWPTGLAANLALAAGSLVVTTRRLRTPNRRLARGQRVA